MFRREILIPSSGRKRKQLQIWVKWRRDGTKIAALREWNVGKITRLHRVIGHTMTSSAIIYSENFI
jgi:hypothetical protein